MTTTCKNDQQSRSRYNRPVNPTDIRYARHLALPEIGEAGQRKLAQSSVLIVGLGGLGSPAAMYLATAGVGRLVLNDFDLVDPTNLQRQVLYRDTDVGRRKVGAAAAMLATLNPAVHLVNHDGRLDSEALKNVITGANVVLDCSDNFGTRFLLNEACFKARKPLISGAAVRLSGQMMSFDFRQGKGPCYACLFNEDGETLEDCAGNGVLAPLVGVIGTLQAVEAIRILVGIGAPSTGRMLRFDATAMAFQESRFSADSACRICSS